MTEEPFLPGVPVAHVRARLAAAGGDEIGSGKFAHPESSAALAVNAFGWFIERLADIPPLPGAEAMGTSIWRGSMVSKSGILSGNISGRGDISSRPWVATKKSSGNIFAIRKTRTRAWNS